MLYISFLNSIQFTLIFLQLEILELFRPISSQENKSFVVWDPFCGTGTTGVACAKFGLQFLGSDYDEAV